MNTYAAAILHLWTIKGEDVGANVAAFLVAASSYDEAIGKATRIGEAIGDPPAFDPGRDTMRKKTLTVCKSTATTEPDHPGLRWRNP
jgi:hypothetical protein